MNLIVYVKMRVAKGHHTTFSPAGTLEATAGRRRAGCAWAFMR